jgi:hypothetical protein
VLAPHRQSVNVGGVPVDTLIRLGVIGVLVSAVAMAASFRAQTPLALRSIEAEATQFKVTMSDGRVLRSPQLVGATLLVAIGAETRRLRIDAVETDPGDPQKGRQPAPNVFLHTLSVEAADGSWQNICLPGPDDRRQAFPLAGRAAPDATIQPAERGAFEITCTGGAQGKCVRFGYGPRQGTFQDTPDGASPYDLYNACVRMVRADCSGDGRGTKRDGTLIDPYDAFGIQRADTGLEFEAGWTRDGAVCVSHVRVRENISLDESDKLPTLRNRTGDACTEEFARAHGALIFNRSRP